MIEGRICEGLLYLFTKFGTVPMFHSSELLPERSRTKISALQKLFLAPPFPTRYNAMHKTNAEKCFVNVVGLKRACKKKC